MSQWSSLNAWNLSRRLLCLSPSSRRLIALNRPFPDQSAAVKLADTSMETTLEEVAPCGTNTKLLESLVLI